MKIVYALIIVLVYGVQIPCVLANKEVEKLQNELYFLKGSLGSLQGQLRILGGNLEGLESSLKKAAGGGDKQPPKIPSRPASPQSTSKLDPSSSKESLHSMSSSLGQKPTWKIGIQILDFLSSVYKKKEVSSSEVKKFFPEYLNSIEGPHSALLENLINGFLDKKISIKEKDEFIKLVNTIFETCAENLKLKQVANRDSFLDAVNNLNEQQKYKIADFKLTDEEQDNRTHNIDKNLKKIENMVSRFEDEDFDQKTFLSTPESFAYAPFTQFLDDSKSYASKGAYVSINVDPKTGAMTEIVRYTSPCYFNVHLLEKELEGLKEMMGYITPMFATSTNNVADNKPLKIIKANAALISNVVKKMSEMIVDAASDLEEMERIRLFPVTEDILKKISEVGARAKDIRIQIRDAYKDLKEKLKSKKATDDLSSKKETTTTEVPKKDEAPKEDKEDKKNEEEDLARIYAELSFVVQRLKMLGIAGLDENDIAKIVGILDAEGNRYLKEPAQNIYTYAPKVLLYLVNPLVEVDEFRKNAKLSALMYKIAELQKGVAKKPEYEDKLSEENLKFIAACGEKLELSGFKKK